MRTLARTAVGALLTLAVVGAVVLAQRDGATAGNPTDGTTCPSSGSARPPVSSVGRRPRHADDPADGQPVALAASESTSDALAEHGRLFAEVSLPDGSPAPEVRLLVRAAAALAGEPGEGWTHLLGSPALERSGAFEVKATYPGYSDSLAEIVVLDATHARATVALRLRPPGRIVLTLTDQDGQPLRDRVHVVARGEDGNSLPSIPLPPTEDGRSGRSSGEDPSTTRSGEAVLDVPAGRVAIEAWAKDRRHVETAVDVEPGAVTPIPLALGRGAAVEGVVVDRGGLPVTGARVVAHPATGYPSGYGWNERRATTDDDGRFRIGGLDPGDVRLDAELDSDDRRRIQSTPELVRLTVPANDVRLVVMPTTWFHLRVLDPTGEPFSGRVDLRYGLDPSTRFRYLLEAPCLCSGPTGYTVDRQGELRGGALPGDRDVPAVVVAEGFLPLAFVVPARPGDDVDLGTKTLDAGADLEGVVVDESGAGLPGAFVQDEDWRAPSHMPWNGCETNGDGRFVLQHLPHDEIELAIHPKGFAPFRVRAKTNNPVRCIARRGGCVEVAFRRRGPWGAQECAAFSPVPSDSDDGRGVVWAILSEAHSATSRLLPGRWRVGFGNPTRIVGEVAVVDGGTTSAVFDIPKK